MTQVPPSVRRLAGGLVMVGFACAQPQQLPGSLVMGEFKLVATEVPGDQGCPLAEAPDPDAGPLTFWADLSSDPQSGSTWMTIRTTETGPVRVSRPASFDGQWVDSVMSAPRTFEACACDSVVVNEEIKVALLSKSQDAWLQGRCPDSAFDGGIPVLLDAGVVPPHFTDAGFDALRACGTLIDVVQPDAGCACAPCSMVFQVHGVRL